MTEEERQKQITESRQRNQIRKEMREDEEKHYQEMATEPTRKKRLRSDDDSETERPPTNENTEIWAKFIVIEDEETEGDALKKMTPFAVSKNTSKL